MKYIFAGTQREKSLSSCQSCFKSIRKYYWTLSSSVYAHMISDLVFLIFNYTAVIQPVIGLWLLTVKVKLQTVNNDLLWLEHSSIVLLEYYSASVLRNEVLV